MIIVTNNNDSGAGSLRQAIADAAAGEEITFAVTGTIPITTTALTITQDVTITGTGSGSLTLQRTAGVISAINCTGGVVSISGVTVTGGLAGQGGGIRNTTTLTLVDVILTGNHGIGEGGGIWNSGSITMTDVVVTANTTVGNGAGIYNEGTITATGGSITANDAVNVGGGLWNSGTLSLTNAPVTGNNSDTGGGGVGNSGTMTLVEVTLDGNTGNLVGEAAYADTGGTITFTRCTISNHAAATSQAVYIAIGGTVNFDNSTASGNVTCFYVATGSLSAANATITNNTVGVQNTPGSVFNIYDTILAGNNTQDLTTDAGDTISAGHNLFGTVSSAITPASGDQFGVLPAALNLGPLQDNGGPTFTHELLPGSIAIDAGDNAGAPATDQRGEQRIQNGTIDIGAYESLAPCLSYTGELPSWLTIQGNCLVVTPGSFRAATKAAANMAAQSALTAFVETATESGDLSCGGCIPPEFSRVEFSGELDAGSIVSDIFTNGGNHYMERHTFNGTAGQSVAIWMNTPRPGGFVPAVALIDPFLNVLATDINDYGYTGNPFIGAGITYTLPMDGVYTIEASTETALQMGTYNVIVSSGLEASLALDNYAEKMIHVPSTNRMFVLHGWGGLSAKVTVINSLTRAVIDTVTLVSFMSEPPNSPARNTLFYNSNDNSVWVGVMDFALTFCNYVRLNPSTGAILETIPCNVATAGDGGQTPGFVPATNTLYDFETFSSAVDHIAVFDCTSKTYDLPISLGGTFFVNGLRYISEINRVLVQVSDRYWLINPADNTISAPFMVRVNSKVGFYLNNLYYTVKSNTPRGLRAVNLLTGAVDHELSFGFADYAVDAMAYNECRDCLMFTVSNTVFTDVGFLAVSANPATFIATDSVVATIDNNNYSWINFVWNSDDDRMWAMYETGLVVVLA